jgi:hypothetical protein
MADQRNYVPLNAINTKNLVQHLLDQKVVDLWAVAVGDYHSVARAKQGDRLAASQFHAAHLLPDIARIAIRENGVAT